MRFYRAFLFSPSIFLSSTPLGPIMYFFHFYQSFTSFPQASFAIVFCYFCFYSFFLPLFLTTLSVFSLNLLPCSLFFFPPIYPSPLSPFCLLFSFLISFLNLSYVELPVCPLRGPPATLFPSSGSCLSLCPALCSLLSLLASGSSFSA